MERKKVVITGIGGVTPLGNDMDSTWESLLAGKSGIGEITKFDASSFPSQIAGELKDFVATDYVDKKMARRLDAFVHYAFAAVQEATKQAGITPELAEKIGSDRCGIIVGSGIGGLGIFQEQRDKFVAGGHKRVSPFFIPALIPNIAGGMLAIDYNFQGVNFSVSTACATGAHAIYTAHKFLRLGEAEIIIAGGTESAITEMGLAGFCAEKALSTRNDDPTAASRPFDKDRDGFVMGEGAGVIIMETEENAKKRGAKILAEVVGTGVSCDANHMTAPRSDGQGAKIAMSNAIKDAGITPADIDYINTHGTSTPLGDRGEVLAIKSVFGEDAYNLKINSTKSMTGHMLGAAGGVEAAVCVKSIMDGMIHPTINLENPDEGFDLDFTPGKKVAVDIKYAVSNSFGFGGHNGSLVFKKYE